MRKRDASAMIEANKYIEWLVLTPGTTNGRSLDTRNIGREVIWHFIGTLSSTGGRTTCNIQESANGTSGWTTIHTFTIANDAVVVEEFKTIRIGGATGRKRYLRAQLVQVVNVSISMVDAFFIPENDFPPTYKP